MFLKTRIIISTLFLLLITACSPTVPTLEYEPQGEYNLEQYSYSVDLTKVENDQVTIYLDCPGLNQETVIFHFPKTIPGTYKELDYGEMIEKINPKNSSGESLPYEKIGKNIFKISNAKNLSSINYKIHDTWDHPKAKSRIWAMGGTNIEKDKNFVINASGWFGFFDGLEQRPVQVKITQPEGMGSYTALPVMTKNENDNSIVFQANNYHHLIDCPIMISEPDTVSFMVANTKVFIESYFDGDETGLSQGILKEIQPSMEAVATFTDSLPVDDYHFILYIRDGREFMKTLQSKDVGIFKKIKALKNNFTLFGMGALEHGNSSFYALTELGDSTYVSLIKRVALHEFMHIFTPLNLHSEYIGDFDYVNPKMSKHLWLYEGITEYFANLIMVQSGLITPIEFFGSKMKGKIRQSAKYPEKKIPFTEMSERVFEKKYGIHYGQVYQRGALIGLLLDIEIIRLTQGQKTLKDIVLELATEYGPNQSFDEETFFDEFTERVHPDLRDWFSKYVEGTVPLDVEGGLAQVGIEYSKKGKQKAPMKILSDYGTKEYRLSLGKYAKIKKVGKKDPIGFQVDDQIERLKLKELFYDEYGNPISEGTEVFIPIKRNDELIELPYVVKHKDQKYSHRLRIIKNMSEQQKHFYSVLIGS